MNARPHSWLYAWRALACLSFVVALVVGAGSAAAVKFTPLGQAPALGKHVIATGVSDDGKVVVGFSADDFFDDNRYRNGLPSAVRRAWRWTATTGFVSLGTLPGGGESFAAAVSKDGAVVVGTATTASGFRTAFRWTASTGMVAVNFTQLCGSQGCNSIGTGVSATGTVVVGQSDVVAVSGDKAFRATNGIATNLGALPPTPPRTFSTSRALGVSRDGNVVVGSSDRGANFREAIRWTAAGGLVSLGKLPGADWSEAMTASADGAVVAGFSGIVNANNHKLFRWTSAGMVDLGALPVQCCNQYAVPYAMSGDGNLIGGLGRGQLFADPNSDGLVAWLWTPRDGVRRLVDVLTAADAALTENFILTGGDRSLPGKWSLSGILGMSVDGRFVVGYGVTSDGDGQQAFLVDLENGQPAKSLGPCVCDYPPIEPSAAGADSWEDAQESDSRPMGMTNVATGNNLIIETDFVGGVTTALAFRRYYNSQDRRNAALGANWRHTYARTLAGLGPGNIVMEASRPDGRIEAFIRLPTGAWLPADRDVRSRLTTTPTGWDLVTEDDTIERYTADGNCAAIITRAGLTTTLAYDSQNRLLSVRGPFGHTLRFSHNANGRLTTMTVPDGSVYQYAYDGLQNLTLVTYADQTAKAYQYGNSSFSNALTAVVDENKVTYATYDYDSSGRLTSSALANGVGKKTIARTATGTKVTDPNGDSHTYTFHPAQFGINRTSTITGTPCVECGGRAFTYDANGFIAKKTDWNGNDTGYVKDARGLELSRTEAANTQAARTISTDWHSTFHLPLKITEPNRVTTFKYDAKGNLLQRTVAAGTQVRHWTYTYTALGQVLSSDGPRTDVADITRNSYNADGTLATITNALGQVTRFTAYDANARLLSMVDPNGLITQLTYDKRGRLLTRNVGGLLTRFTYDLAGQLGKITAPDGSFTTSTYDAAHRLTQIANQRGEKIVYMLDAAGNRIKEETLDAAGDVVRTRTNVYGPANRLVFSTSPNGLLSSYQHDGNGNITRSRNGQGEETALAYDGLNRLVSGIDPDGGQTRRDYDGNDNLTSVTDPLRLITQYGYDGLGNRIAINSPDTGVTNQSFDAVGNVVNATDAAGRLMSSSYDALNRVTQTRYGGTIPSAFAYDQGTNGIGQLTQLTDSSGATNWNYDLLGRPLIKRQTAGSVTLRVQYAYDSAGHLKSMTYPSGAVVQYSYTGELLTQISVNGAPILSGITYEPFGPSNGWVWGTGASVARTFDKDGRIQSYPIGDRTRTLTYDRAHRITGMSDSAGANALYGYDRTGRLTTASGGSVSESYSYDLNGNRTSASTLIGGVIAQANYGYASGSNRLARLNDVVAQVLRTILYDATGNTVGDGINHYVYDGRNRLTQVTNAKGLSAYLINGLGQRVTKYLGTGAGGSVLLDLAGDANHDGKLDTTDLRLIALMAQGASPVDLAADCNHDGKVTLADVSCTQAKIADIRLNPTKYANVSSGIAFLHDEAGQLIGEYTQSSQPIQETIYLGHTPVAVLTGGKTYQVYADHLNTPRVITDSSNAEVWKWDADAFGITGPVSTTNPSFVYNLRFPGQYFDSETGLHYNGFRDYNPSTGRYVQSDPIGLAGGINTFSYAASNPLTKFDPDGRIVPLLWVAGGAFALGYVLTPQPANAPGIGDEVFPADPTAPFLNGIDAAALVAIGGACFAEKLAAQSVASLPTKSGQLGHIFRNAIGHLADTPASRQLLTDVAGNAANRIGVDKFGNVWSAVTRADGTQIWASTRNGVIQNGGLNQVPQTFPNIVGP